MKLKDLKTALALHPEALPCFILPGGGRIPRHFHITEVGHATKRFIDCGGRLHDKKDTCVLQTWVSDGDLNHRLKAGTFAKILELGDQVLPHDDIDVEVEYDCCVVAQYPVATVNFTGGIIDIQLGQKHTDCLAKEQCGIDDSACGREGKEAGVTASCC